MCVCVTGHQKSETVSSASESGTSETSADQHRPELKDQFFQCSDWFLQSVYQDMHGQPGQQGQVSGFVFYNCLHYIYNMFTSISVLVTAETCSVALQIQSLYQIVFVFGCLFTSTFLKVSHIGFLFTRQTAHMCPWLNCRQRPCLLAELHCDLYGAHTRQELHFKLEGQRGLGQLFTSQVKGRKVGRGQWEGLVVWVELHYNSLFSLEPPERGNGCRQQSQCDEISKLHM